MQKQNSWYCQEGGSDLCQAFLMDLKKCLLLNSVFGRVCSAHPSKVRSVQPKKVPTVEARRTLAHPQGSRQLVLDPHRRQLALLNLVARKSSQILPHILPMPDLDRLLHILKFLQGSNLEGLHAGRLQPVGKHLLL